MNKNDFANTIKKYYLDGECNAVKWTVEDNSLKITFNTGDKSTLGYLTANAELPSGEYGIYNTDKLLSILNALDTDIDVSFNYERNKVVGLNLTDKKIDVSFMLADLSVLPETSNLNRLPDWDFEFVVDKNFINTFIKSKKAIQDANYFAFITDDQKVDVIINYDTINNNRISFSIPATVNKQTDFIMFNANVLTTILTSNVSDFKTGKISVSELGIMQIEFVSEDCEIKYYMKKIVSNS